MQDPLYPQRYADILYLQFSIFYLVLYENLTMNG